MYQEVVCPSCGWPVHEDLDRCYYCGIRYPTEPAKTSHPATEWRLATDTSGWTQPVIVRQYANTQEGRDAFATEADVFGQFGYTPIAQSEEGGHIHVGRLLLTGGLSVLAGKKGIRSDGTISVTFHRAVAAGSAQPEPTVAVSSTVPAQIRQLGELRDAGLLTEGEFAAKKAELLARM